MIKENSRKRLISLTIVFFVITSILISTYFYTSIKTNVDAIDSVSQTIKEYLLEKNVFSSIQNNLSGIEFLVLFQSIIFVLAVICLSLCFWFLYTLYYKERRNSLIDPLTQIYNRRAIMKSLDKELKRSLRYKHHLSIAVLDLDNFKKYNDSNGHIAGDRLLKKFSRLISQQIRKYDLVGRIGGEEFIVLLPETKLKDAAVICERIRERVEKTKFYGEHNLPNKKATVSIGLVEFKGQRKITKENLIHKADLLLYKAKEQGRNILIYK